MFPSKIKPTGRQIFDGVSLVIAIAGVVLSIYFYFAQRESKAISFIADPKRALLVSPKHLPTTRITLFDQDGKRIAGDVYSVDLYLWNSGTKTIDGPDVINPIIVNLPLGTRLLDLQPIHVSRQSVTQMAASALKRPDGDAIQFHFNTLEPGDGISASLLYEGEQDADFLIKGGVKGIREITDSKQIVNQEKWLVPWKQHLPDIGEAVLGFGTIGLVIFLWHLLSRRFFPDRARDVKKAIAAIVFSLFFLYVIVSSIITFIEPWRHPEKIIRANITDYIPSELTKR
ncbi:MAG TPA: hypothetical protein VNP98_02975 [Chthoniobacterales bacterium]|nr:hypothetical protein [Chthoniobacterales bacterium]